MRPDDQPEHGPGPWPVSVYSTLGRISPGNVDEIRNFRSFLADVGGIPTRAARRTPEQQRAFLEAYREHYPDDYARELARQRAEQEDQHP